MFSEEKKRQWVDFYLTFVVSWLKKTISWTELSG
jgi:hypothetical protein